MYRRQSLMGCLYILSLPVSPGEVFQVDWLEWMAAKRTLKKKVLQCVEMTGGKGKLLSPAH